MTRWICIRCTSTSLTTLGGFYQLPECGAGIEIETQRETISPDDGILILFLS
jgi:hypothetical protein